jgi:UDP-GlcNAc:undecaprenyl-phosphate/decaprenyl-phosphate GlcNAc-1-phosphate transferase
MEYFNFFIFFVISCSFTLVVLKFINPKLDKLISIPNGPQKIHKENITRFGGISIYFTILLIGIINFFDISLTENTYFLLIVASSPVFLCGFLEDITQSISPKKRLLGSLLSAILFIIIFQKFVSKVGINQIDFLLKYQLISIFFTLLCVTFLIQAFNIIDGLNGLSLSTCILSLLTVSVISYYNENFEIFSFSLSMIFVLVGVLIFNFPHAKIFIGDGGAYLIGFILASILIIFINNINVSSFVVLQIIIYPSYELIRSIIRRRFFEKRSVSEPDLKHLHSILYLYFLTIKSKGKLNSNILSSCLIILIQVLNCAYIIYFFNEEKIIIFGIVTFCIIYETVYNYLKFCIRNC